MVQVNRLKTRLAGEDFTEALLVELLDTAKDIIFENRFPNSEHPAGLEHQYLGLQIRIAVELFNKIGAEGQQGHSENGINRSWTSADVSPALLSQITPVVKVVRGR